MGAKKYDRTTINFGEPGDPARAIKSRLIEVHGKAAFSEHVRRALVAAYSSQRGFEKTKADIKFNELRKVISDMKELALKRSKIEEELQELGKSSEEIQEELMKK
ncbi:MAG: hypothetical protein ACLFTR_03380 [Candidatus Woesearchaeota archaeon]